MNVIVNLVRVVEELIYTVSLIGLFSPRSTINAEGSSRQHCLDQPELFSPRNRQASKRICTTTLGGVHCYNSVMRHQSQWPNILKLETV